MKTRISLTFLAAAALGFYLPLLSGLGKPTPGSPAHRTGSSAPVAQASPDCRSELQRLTSTIRAHQDLYGSNRRPGLALTD